MMMTFNYVFSYWYLKEGLLCGHPTRPYHMGSLCSHKSGTKWSNTTRNSGLNRHALGKWVYNSQYVCLASCLHIILRMIDTPNRKSLPCEHFLNDFVVHMLVNNLVLSRPSLVSTSLDFDPPPLPATSIVEDEPMQM